MDLETEMKEDINYRRKMRNKRRTSEGEDYELGPGDKGYLPPVQDFVTIQFRHGTIVLPAEEFNKLSKTKQRKLMKW